MNVVFSQLCIVTYYQLSSWVPQGLLLQQLHNSTSISRSRIVWTVQMTLGGAEGLEDLVRTSMSVFSGGMIIGGPVPVRNESEYESDQRDAAAEDHDEWKNALLARHRPSGTGQVAHGGHVPRVDAFHFCAAGARDFSRGKCPASDSRVEWCELTMTTAKPTESRKCRWRPRKYRSVAITSRDWTIRFRLRPSHP